MLEDQRRSEEIAVQRSERVVDQLARAESREWGVETLAAVVRELGGPERIGQRVARNYKRTIGEGLTKEEGELFEFRPTSAQKYDAMLLNAVQQQDAADRDALTGVSSEDLVNVLFSEVSNLIGQDEQFTERVIQSLEQAGYAVIDQREAIAA